MVSLFLSEFVEIFRLCVNFTAIVVMPEKQTREAARERSSYEVHLAFFHSTLLIVNS
jgi:hypothetical protein